MSKNSSGGNPNTLVGSVTVPNTTLIAPNGNQMTPFQVNGHVSVHVDLKSNIDFQNLVGMVKILLEKVETLEKHEKDLIRRVQKSVGLKKILSKNGSE